MPRAAPRDPIYHGRRYSPEVIELCIRWYLTYRLSYRDLSAMMAERDVAVSHTTIMRWAQHYVRGDRQAAASVSYVPVARSTRTALAIGSARTSRPSRTS